MSLSEATFIAPDAPFDGAPLLRQVIELDQDPREVASATFRLSALGVVEASINGTPISPDVLTPGWTTYQWRLRYSEVDVAGLLDRSRIAIVLALGNGWYRGRLGWSDGAEPYGPEIAGFAELRIVYRDGSEQVISTDENWRSGPSVTTFNSLYDGQTIDARRRADWGDPDAPLSADWLGVHRVDYDLDRLEPYVGPPVRRVAEVEPQRIWTSPSGRVLVDFGQNLVGWVRVRVRGSAGATVTLRHAEVLEHGELGVRPLRTAQATDRFVLSGGEDEFEPTFTFHGFRYVEVDGWPGGVDALMPGSLTAVAVSSDLRRIGRFETSHPLINRLHENVVWGMRGNFVDVPTDCPQRDERLGWTGDIAAFAPTAAFLSDVNGFLQDWLKDLALEQRDQGFVPYTVPDTIRRMYEENPFQPVEATAIWADAAVWVPWALWEAYGDETALRSQYESIADHVRHVGNLLSPTGLWDRGFQFGDWLDPDAPPAQADQAKADKSVVATACAYRTAELASRIASQLGHADDAAEFRSRADHIRSAFRSAYVHNGRITSDATTAYTLAIVFGLLENDELVWAGDRLAELVAESGFRISTGFAGTPFITDALSSTGHIRTAYRLLMQTENPSWLYPVTMDATTIWERWDSMLPDGSINEGEMTSFNHYALGAVVDWMHRVVGGIAPLAPGYARILIAPQPGPGIEWATTSLDSPHGTIRVHWEISRTSLSVEVDIPDRATGVLRLPDGTESQLNPGHHVVTTDRNA